MWGTRAQLLPSGLFASCLWLVAGMPRLLQLQWISCQGLDTHTVVAPALCNARTRRQFDARDTVVL